MGKTKALTLDKLRIDGGTQIRVSLSEDTVKEYAEAYQEGVELPPVKAVFDGSEYWLWEGFHRWHASRRAGLGEIQAEISQGTQRDAILLACGANASHGLKRTNADKRKAVETLLADEEWKDKSDRWIADACQVSHTFVSGVRSESTGNVASSKPRNGKDGKSRKPPPSAAKSPKEQMAEFFNGKSEPEPEPEDTPIDYGACPHCKGTKWTETDDGVNCSRCNHPHGEPVGDVSDDRVKTGRERSPAKLVDELLKKHIGPLARGIVVVAEINGGKGDEYHRVNDALSVANDGLREMRKGKI